IAWASISHRVVAAAVTGGLLGLAVLAKELAGLYVVVFLCVAGIDRLWRQRSRPIANEDRQALVVLALAGALPFACFEMWKLVALGWHGYFLHWYDHLGFLLHQSTGTGRRTVAELIVERAHIFRQRFFLAPALVFGLMGIAVGLVMRVQDRVAQA